MLQGHLGPTDDPGAVVDTVDHDSRQPRDRKAAHWGELSGLQGGSGPPICWIERGNRAAPAPCEVASSQRASPRTPPQLAPPLTSGCRRGTCQTTRPAAAPTLSTLPSRPARCTSSSCRCTPSLTRIPIRRAAPCWAWAGTSATRREPVGAGHRLGPSLLAPRRRAPCLKAPLPPTFSVQYAWLARELDAINRTETPWVVASFHQPW